MKNKTEIAPQTLRSCFDPYSSEYSKTTMEQKVDVLRKCLAERSGLEILAIYTQFYEEAGKHDVIAKLPEGLMRIIKHITMPNQGTP